MTDGQPTPDLHALVGEMTPEEEAGLRRVHTLLLLAGAPPEGPLPALVPPWTQEREQRREKQRQSLVWPRLGRAFSGFRVVLATGAVALAALVGFGIGLEHQSSDTQEVYSLAFHATRTAPQAQGTLVVDSPDRAGNHRLELRVRGLPERAGYYDLLLTRPGRAPLLCGAFRVDGGLTIVKMTVPYDLSHHPGWVIAAHGQPPLLVTQL
jgi:hypothetical protein